MSGPFSVYGPRHNDGAEFAAQQLNDEGGVRDRDVQIETVDTESDATEAVSAFTRLIEQEDAVAAIGPGSSEVAIRTGEIGEEREVPVYMHAAGAVEVVPKDSRYRFRTALPATPTVVRAQAQMLEERDYTNVGVVFEDGVWGDEYRAAMDAYFPDGLEYTMDTAPIPETDFVPYLRSFPDDVEVVLGTAHPAGISKMYPQMYEVGLDPDLFLGAITPKAADYAALGDQITRSFSSFNRPDFYSDEFSDVATTFHEETGALFDTAQANAYVTVQLIASAIEEAGSTDPSDIAEATRTGSFDSLYPQPLEYTEWGEPKNSVQIYHRFNTEETMEYWPDGEFALEEEFRTDPLPAFDPDDFDQ